jgi:hypothetical protein
MPQAIHVLCQTPGRHTPATIAAALKLEPGVAKAVVTTLLRLGLLTEVGGGLASAQDFLHTGKDSQLIRRTHVNWRLKTVADMLAGHSLDGVHFSAVATMSEETAMTMRRLFVDCLQKAKTMIAKSPPQKVQAIAIDFYDLLGG